MAVVLGSNRYGKAETRMVCVARDGERHAIRDLNVSVALSGDLDAVHTRGDNAGVVATDSQKNTVYAFAKEHGVGALEDFALLLGRHFVREYPAIAGARVEIDEQRWERIAVDGGPHPHAFVRPGGERRTAIAACGAGSDRVLSGVADLVVLKSTGSEFGGFVRDRFTTLPETDDRILATAITARWRHRETARDFDGAFTRARTALLERFASLHSLSLQQSLHAMAEAMLSGDPGLAEVRMSMPNKHHFLVDLAPFGLENPGEVFFAADRPYGLIEAAVLAADAPDAGPAWDPHPLL